LVVVVVAGRYDGGVGNWLFQLVYRNYLHFVLVIITISFFYFFILYSADAGGGNYDNNVNVAFKGGEIVTLGEGKRRSMTMW
jgi:hypothetical protein